MSLFPRLHLPLCLALLTLQAHAVEVPWEPAMRDDSADWANTVTQQAEAVKQAQARIIFIGDSLTENWDEEIWKARIAPLNALNFGVGGEGPQHVLWRMEHGILDGAAPETVVLMVGINNFWRDFSGADTARGIAAIVARVHEKHPATRIVLLGLLPVYEAASPIRPWIAEINTRLKQVKEVEFFDLSAAFLEADGNQRLQLYKEDHLHLSKAGYVVLTRELTPVLKLP
ncbi:MAG: GDSL-like lipase/acylhydrolase domain containing protein [Prosthecobacter sp.]|nr:GDSL-like lipase/acylhydrolase domain containing protein [Prosthecobacter sp.]